MKNQNETTKNDYVVLPNPIYDVVFKYLMEDIDSAKIILSTLIGEEIIKLDFEQLSHSGKKNEQDKKSKEEKKAKVKNTEIINNEDNIENVNTKNKLKEVRIKDPKTNDDIRLFHLDFTALIRLSDGTEELIMIELQKASKPDDIFRFKRYISKNFQKEIEKEIIDPKTKALKKIKVPIRLIPIFILNFRIEHEINDLLIKINRITTGVFTNTKFKEHIEFIDNLTYNLWVIQLPNIKAIEKSGSYKDSEYKTKLFQLLKLFDQNSIYKSNEHRLRFLRRFFPDFLDRVIQRLQAADINNPDLEEQMYAEDEFLRLLEDRDNRISDLEQEIDEKDKEFKLFKLQFAKLLKDSEKTTEEIQKQTKLSKEEIEKL